MEYQILALDLSKTRTGWALFQVREAAGGGFLLTEVECGELPLPYPEAHAKTWWTATEIITKEILKKVEHPLRGGPPLSVVYEMPIFGATSSETTLYVTQRVLEALAKRGITCYGFTAPHVRSWWRNQIKPPYPNPKGKTAKKTLAHIYEVQSEAFGNPEHPMETNPYPTGKLGEDAVDALLLGGFAIHHIIHVMVAEMSHMREKGEKDEGYLAHTVRALQSMNWMEPQFTFYENLRAQPVKDLLKAQKDKAFPTLSSQGLHYNTSLWIIRELMQVASDKELAEVFAKPEHWFRKHRAAGRALEVAVKSNGDIIPWVNLLEGAK